MKEVYEAFLLMFNLSQMQNTNVIIKIFVEFLNGSWDNADFSFSGDKRQNTQSENKNSIIIGLQNIYFGCIKYNDNFNNFSDKDISLIKNMIRILAIILSNKMQEKILKNEVETRTKELEISNKQLTIKNNQVTGLLDEMKSFLYTVSHDLKSPLGNIHGFTNEIYESLKSLKNIDGNADINEIKKIISDDIFECFGLLKLSIDKTNTLLDGLLKISRSLTVKSNIRKINMNGLIKDISGNYKIKLSDISAVITAGDLPDCLCDETQANQIFTNLIDNAIKYRSGNRNLKILISGKEANGLSEYLVEDNGRGIDKKYTDKIFEIFFRIDREEIPEGEGIGLTIVKRLLERNNGSISVDSVKDEKTAFTVKLPFSE